VQRYVYVELQSDADPEQVAATIRADPLFLDEETLVLPVESAAALEAEGHGSSSAGPTGAAPVPLLLLEARSIRSR
jgi:diaminopimelate dehydrogenase